MRDDSKTVARRNEGFGAVDHVSVAITVASSAEVDAIIVDSFDERVRIDEVRVRVAASKVGRWHAVLGTAAGKAELLFENSNAIGAGDPIKSVEQNFEIFVAGEERFDHREVENVSQHLDVVGGGVDDLYFERTVGLTADVLEVDVGYFGDLVGRK